MKETIDTITETAMEEVLSTLDSDIWVEIEKDLNKEGIYASLWDGLNDQDELI